eukprot:6027277-Pyramimonas_sp.AAC.5
MGVGARPAENNCPTGRLIPGVAATCGFLLLIVLYWFENRALETAVHAHHAVPLISSKDQITITWLETTLKLSPSGSALLTGLANAGESLDHSSFKVNHSLDPVHAYRNGIRF